MIQAILFDLGKVLVGFDFERGFRAIEAHSRYRAAEIPDRIAASGLVPVFERGEISSDEFFRRLSDTLGLSVSYERFCDLWTAIFLPEPLISEDLLAALARRYRLVLVSNTNEIHFRMIERTYGLLRHFHAKVLSFEVRAMKPSPVIFQEAVRQARCEPGECFYTDDVAEFVDGARRLGIDAVVFQGQAGVERELLLRGVQW